MKKGAVILLSGGLDSGVCLFLCCKEFVKITAITFDYGQKNSGEIFYAKKQIEEAKKIHSKKNINHSIINISGVLCGSSLTEHELDINSVHQRDKQAPSSFLAGRNLLFLTIAMSKAYNLGYKHIISGIRQSEYGGYPDVRDVFVKSFERTAFLATKQRFEVHAPLMNKTRAETWKIAKDLDIVDLMITHTLTDYNGNETLNEWGRGSLDNPASIKRKKGWKEAKRLGYI